MALNDREGELLFGGRVKFFRICALTVKPGEPGNSEELEGLTYEGSDKLVNSRRTLHRRICDYDAPSIPPKVNRDGLSCD